MRIAIFDYKVTSTNPIGSCHLALLRALAQEHEFTVFAPEFENPHPARIQWVRVPAPKRPLALLFVMFHCTAPLCYRFYRLRGGRRFDVVQAVESNLSFGDVIYSQFCHCEYLEHHWSKSNASGVRGAFRWLDHTLHAWMEGMAYARARRVVVPSRGLAKELTSAFPSLAGKLTVVPNPIRVEHLQMPADFDRAAIRNCLGLQPNEVVALFVALGHFERKGLPVLLEALRAPETQAIKLIVVGGLPDLVAHYTAGLARLGLSDRVKLVGMHSDVRPFLWSADVFVFPSLYETFSLVTYDAAASGLPILVSHLHGVEDLIQDGENGFLIETDVAGVKKGLQRFLALTPHARVAMGERARVAASACAEEHFVDAWRAFYLQQSSKEPTRRAETIPAIG